MMDNTKIKLTGLWRQESKAGDAYLAGKVSPSVRMLVFSNSHKKTDGDPDYIAYLTPAKDSQEQDPEQKVKTDSLF